LESTILQNVSYSELKRLLFETFQEQIVQIQQPPIKTKLLTRNEVLNYLVCEAQCEKKPLQVFISQGFHNLTGGDDEIASLRLADSFWEIQKLKPRMLRILILYFNSILQAGLQRS
jgi:hypothetical protein